MVSRFSDNPFRDPNMPKEQQEYLDRRNAAMRYYYETGDPEPLAEFGFHPRSKVEEKRLKKAEEAARAAAELEAQEQAAAEVEETPAGEEPEAEAEEQPQN